MERPERVIRPWERVDGRHCRLYPHLVASGGGQGARYQIVEKPSVEISRMELKTHYYNAPPTRLVFLRLNLDGISSLSPSRPRLDILSPIALRNMRNAMMNDGAF